jgi:pimeloyl-ACP methyl ester carboxylesterase
MPYIWVEDSPARHAASRVKVPGMPDKPRRVAVYYAPAPEDRFGLPAVAGSAATRNGASPASSPRRYGAHATLKPPLQLRGSYQAFFSDVENLAAGMAALDMPQLEVVRLKSFLALCPMQPSPLKGQNGDAANAYSPLSAQPAITVPSVTPDGATDGIRPARTASHSVYFNGRQEHRVIANAGHTLPQENPTAFLEAILTIRAWQQGLSDRRCASVVNREHHDRIGNFLRRNLCRQR